MSPGLWVRQGTVGDMGRGSRRSQGRRWRQIHVFRCGAEKKILFIPRSRAATIRMMAWGGSVEGTEVDLLQRAWSILSQPIHHFVACNMLAIRLIVNTTVSL